jgi:hypothetical protein
MGAVSRQEELTHIRETTLVREPFTELHLSGVHHLPPVFKHLRRHAQHTPVIFPAGKQDPAFLKGLPHGGEAIGFAVHMARRGVHFWQRSLMEG